MKSLIQYFIPQGQYAADLLYLMALYFSKMSSIIYVMHITPDAKHRFWGKILQVVISVWVFVSFLGVAFECGIPSPWAIVTRRCMNIVSSDLVIAFGPFDLFLANFYDREYSGISSDRSTS